MADPPASPDPGPWHLPGLSEGTGRALEEGTSASGRPFRVPRLGSADAAAVAAEVAAAALEARRQLDEREVVGAVSRAAVRLADAGDPVGVAARDILRDELGWTAPLASETLTGMSRGWSATALLSVVRRELGDPAILDGWTLAGAGVLPGRLRRAAGPRLLLVVHSGAVPGVAVTAAIRGLLVRSGVLCRAPEAEPGLLALFARALSEELPLLGRCVATTWWPGTYDPPWEAWVTRAGKVVIYGGDEAVSGVRARLPGHVGLIVYGPRVGVAAVLPDAPLEETAAALARDVCAYEQQGCVSPRLVFAVDRGTGELADALAAALERETARIPRPPPDRATAVAMRAARAEVEFAALAGDPVSLRAGEGESSWTVVEGGDPLRTDALPRFVRVHGVADAAQLEELLAPLAGRLQSVGYAGSEELEALADAAARLGACRVAPLGTQAWPPADWLHDGRPQLLPLLSWTEWE